MSDTNGETEQEQNIVPNTDFSTAELQVLYKRRDYYRAKERTLEERRKVIQKCCKGIKPFNQGLTDKEWEARKQVSAL